jgi:hypothetical protein
VKSVINVQKVDERCTCGSEARAWPVDSGKRWAIACFRDECDREVVAATLADALIDWHDLAKVEK